MGLATYPHDAKTPHDVIRQADEMMYLVKNTTRDSVAAAGMGVLPSFEAPPVEEPRAPARRSDS